LFSDKSKCSRSAEVMFGHLFWHMRLYYACISLIKRDNLIETNPRFSVRVRLSFRGFC